MLLTDQRRRLECFDTTAWAEGTTLTPRSDLLSEEDLTLLMKVLTAEHILELIAAVDEHDVFPQRGRELMEKRGLSPERALPFLDREDQPAAMRYVLSKTTRALMEKRGLSPERARQFLERGDKPAAIRYVLSKTRCTELTDEEIQKSARLMEDERIKCYASLQLCGWSYDKLLDRDWRSPHPGFLKRLYFHLRLLAKRILD